MAWLDNLTLLAKELKKNPPPNNDELAKTLKTSDRMLTIYFALNQCFDTVAINKIRMAAKATNPYELSLNSARALTSLRGKVDDVPKAANAALDVIISHRLIPLKIKGLLVHMASGKPVKDFDPTRVKRRSPSQKQIKVKGKNTQEGDKTDVQTPGAAFGREGELPPQKPGEKPDWKGIREAIYGAATLVFIILFARCAWHDFKTWEGTQNHSDAAATPAVGNNPSGSNEATNAEPTSIQNLKLNIQNSGASAPAAPAAWTPSVETETQLENEFFPIPNYCLVKVILPPPMSRMDEAMAGNLLSRLGDSSKYSVWYGNDGVTVESAVANPESLTLAFRGKDLVVLDWNGPSSISKCNT